MPGGHSYRNGAGSVRGFDVKRRVAHDHDLLRIQAAPEDRAPALDRTPSELGPVLGIRSISSEAEEPVQCRSRKLDVGRGLQPAGRDTEKEALLAEAREEFIHAV